jgi:preprotein translocase subunit Sss1
MSNNNPPTSVASPSSQVSQIFKSASKEHQELIREILKEERYVQHMTRRPDIHNKIYDHVRRLIK